MKPHQTFAFISLVTLANVVNAADPVDARRPAAIATENVPVVPAEIFSRLLQYQNIRSASFAGWAPGGDGMMIHTRFGNSTQVHQVRHPGGAREQLTFLDEPVVGQFVPQSKAGDLLLSMSHGGDENFQVLRLDRAEWKTTLLTDGKSRNQLGPVSRDGRRVAINSNLRNGRDMDIYVGDLTQKPFELKLHLSRPGEYWSAHDWSPDGRQLLVSRYVSINESYPGLLDAQTGELTPLKLPAEGKAAVGAMVYSHDGQHAFITTDAKSEFLELYRLDLATNEYDDSWTSGWKWDVHDVVCDHETGRLAFSTNEDGASRVYVIEGDGMQLDLPLGVVSNLQFSPEGKRLGMTISRADATTDAYSIDLADFKLTRWTFSETGGLNSETFVAPELVRFKSFDERTIPAFVYRPRSRGDGKLPVLINIHGGPESQYRPNFSAITQMFVNELGLCVIAPNVRGSAGYGKSYLLLDNGPKRSDPVKDIGALLDWIATQPDLDASRVAVTGGSYGGFMVLASLVMHGERLRAGIDVVGVASFITMLETTSPYRQDLRRAEYGDERDSTMRDFFQQVSPLYHADQIRSALLVVHGRNDPRVPFSEAQQIAKRVRASGRAVWAVYADNEGHGFAKKDNRDYQAAVEVLFLQQNLLNLD